VRAFRLFRDLQRCADQRRRAIEYPAFVMTVGSQLARNKVQKICEVDDPKQERSDRTASRKDAQWGAPLVLCSFTTLIGCRGNRTVDAAQPLPDLLGLRRKVRTEETRADKEP